MKINENELAKAIAQREGKCQQLTIAQIKEVLKVTLEMLALYPASEVMALIEKHGD